MKKKGLVITTLVLGLLVFGLVYKVHAATIQAVNVDPRGDFVLEPAVAEIYVNPGETVTRDLFVTDRIPGQTSFKTEIEDIEGTNDPNQTVVILNNGEKGPYSAKDFITTDPSGTFTLSLGQEITIPVTITIPKDAQPGGFYSAVLISNEPNQITSNGEPVQGGVRVISRVGSLFFIRVNGPVNESGQLKSLSLDGPSKLFYDHGPFSFNILFENNGNVHLVPYGMITIKNIFGEQVAQVPVDAYYSLPQSLRSRQVTWNQATLFGRYTATLVLNRGYGNLTDTQTISFWVIPWKILLAVFAGLFLVILIITVFLRTFEIKKK